LKKRNKKLLLPWAMGFGAASPRGPRDRNLFGMPF
jgi:hypothetical protein